MISALAWIPRGAAQAIPTLADLSPEELKALQAQEELPEVPQVIAASVLWSVEAPEQLHHQPQADSDSDAESQSMDEEDNPEAAVTRAKAAAKALTTTTGT